MTTKQGLGALFQLRTACEGLVPTFLSDAKPGCLFSLSKSKPLFSFVCSTNSCGMVSQTLALDCSLWDCTNAQLHKRPVAHRSLRPGRALQYTRDTDRSTEPGGRANVVTRPSCTRKDSQNEWFAHLCRLFNLLNRPLLCPSGNKTLVYAAERVRAGRWPGAPRKAGGCGQRDLRHHCAHHLCSVYVVIVWEVGGIMRVLACRWVQNRAR